MSETKEQIDVILETMEKTQALLEEIAREAPLLKAGLSNLATEIEGWKYEEMSSIGVIPRWAARLRALIDLYLSD